MKKGAGSSTAISYGKYCKCKFTQKKVAAQL